MSLRKVERGAGREELKPMSSVFYPLPFSFFCSPSFSLFLLYVLSGCTRRTTPEFVHHIHHWICSFLLCPCNSNCHSSWIQVTGEPLKRVEKSGNVFQYDSIRLWQNNLVLFLYFFHHLISLVLYHFCVSSYNNFFSK